MIALKYYLNGMRAVIVTGIAQKLLACVFKGQREVIDSDIFTFDVCFSMHPL